MADIKGLSQFKEALKGGGARPNLFEVEIANFPEGWADPQGLGEWSSDVIKQFKFLCKSAALPASNISPIEIPFRGRTFKVAGDRTFDTWTITIINDSDFAIRRAFEGWMQYIGQYSDHSGVTNPNDYMVNATVYQLGRAPVKAESGTGTGGKAEVNAQYRFIDIFPTSISAIDLSYDSSDTIEEFTVDMQVQFWYPEKEGTEGRQGSDTTV